MLVQHFYYYFLINGRRNSRTHINNDFAVSLYALFVVLLCIFLPVKIVLFVGRGDWVGLGPARIVCPLFVPWKINSIVSGERRELCIPRKGHNGQL